MNRRPLISILMICTGLFSGLLAHAAPDILLADFERRDYGRWTVQGDAFGPGPARGTLPDQMEVSGYQGKGLVNSFYGGDEPTGTLTSPEFTIQRPYLNFYVGGGGFEGETCINLVVGDETVRTATGPNTEPGGSETLRRQSWDVAEFQGVKARIQIVDKRSGGWGHINVDHIVQSAQPVRHLDGISREFLIKRDLLIFPIGRNAPSQLLTLSVDGERVREMGMKLASGEPAYWVFLDTAEFAGRTASLRAEHLTDAQLDAFFAIRQSDTYPGEHEVYQEKQRPQLHFSSKRGWNNDPNGMMYYDGEYHLFYQHNPFGWEWGNMTWGHAVSTDLVHWTELGDALHPDEHGTMFSGSGVVDWKNTTEFQTGEDPPLICIYTNAGGTNPWSEGKPFTQGIAYSNDRGRTWTKYEGNPVQGHLNDGNRDPKVIWWEETNEWVIVLYLKDERMAFFRSPDLKRWELQSILPSFHECPELFQLPVDGTEQDSKWILYGASGEYFVGQFDGSQFKRDGEAIRFNYGDCFYASQTFSDIPAEDGRRIQIGWGAGNEAPGMPFNQMMTFPVVLTLQTTVEGPRMFASPVKEIEKLYVKRHKWENVSLTADARETAPGVEGELFDIETELAVGDSQQVGLVIRGKEIIYDVAQEQLIFGENEAPLAAVNGCIRLRCIVDRTSLEIFANAGRIYMPCRFRSQPDNRKLSMFARGGTAQATSLQVRELKSIWSGSGPTRESSHENALPYR